MTRKQTEANWRRRDRIDGDPVWQAQVGALALQVSVPCGSPWFFDWTVYDVDIIELARGSVYIEHADDEEEDWDYQHVEIAQIRCEAVARVFAEVADGEEQAEVDPRSVADGLCNGEWLALTIMARNKTAAIPKDPYVAASLALKGCLRLRGTRCYATPLGRAVAALAPDMRDDLEVTP